MPKVQPLSSAEIEAGLKTLEGWTVVGGKLHRELKFKNFVEAFAFMTQVAIHAEKMDHHPEWSNVYSKVVVDLVTHDAGNSISRLDFELAGKIDKIVG